MLHEIPKKKRDLAAETMCASKTIMDSRFSGLFSLALLILIAFPGGGRAQTEADCFYQIGNQCPISGMADNVRYSVFPGGDTRCFFSTPDFPNPYKFQVTKGRNADENNTIIYFQGGGGCTHNGIEDSTCVPIEENRETVSSVVFFNEGILKRTAENPFADWTTVIVGYCSGDVGIGDTVTADGIVHFNGRRNVKAVLQWVAANRPSPGRVLLTGDSAGAFSLQFWANRIIQYYKTVPTTPPIITVVMDCYVGINLPSTFEWEQWEFCAQEDFGWSDATLEKCETDNDFYNVDVQLPVQQDNRDTPFAFVTHKDDDKQRLFFWREAFSESDFPAWLIQKAGGYENFEPWYGNKFVYSQTESYQDMRDLIRTYTIPNNENNNVISYFQNSPGPVHCTIGNPAFFSAGNGFGDPTLKEWVTSLAYRTNGTTVKSSCQVATDEKKKRDLSCDSDLTGATFVY
jgi:Pectinacetylesterase